MPSLTSPSEADGLSLPTGLVEGGRSKPRHPVQDAPAVRCTCVTERLNEAEPAFFASNRPH